MGNAASQGIAPAASGAPQGAPRQSLAKEQPHSAGTEQRPPDASGESALADPLVIATIWLAFVTTLLALYTYRLWAATLTLAGDAKASSERQLRAYVGIEDQGLEPYEFGSAETGKVMFNIKNYGQTPAFQSVTKISLAVAPYDRKAPIIPDAWDRDVERAPRDIPPNGNVRREVSLPVDEILARWEELNEGKAAIFVRIEITYSSFGRRYRQTTVMHAAGKRYGEGKLNTTRQDAEEKIAAGAAVIQ